MHSCITYLGRGPSPLEGGQQGSVPGIRGPGWQPCIGGTCLGPLACCQPWAKGPVGGGSALFTLPPSWRSRGNVPYNCMRESPPLRPHKGIRTLGSRHFEIVKYLESKTGYEILPPITRWGSYNAFSKLFFYLFFVRHVYDSNLSIRRTCNFVRPSPVHR